MSTNLTVELKGVQAYSYIMKRFNMSPDEAAETMKKHGQYTDDVCEIHTMLNKHVLHQNKKDASGTYSFSGEYHGDDNAD